MVFAFFDYLFTKFWDGWVGVAADAAVVSLHHGRELVAEQYFGIGVHS